MLKLCLSLILLLVAFEASAGHQRLICPECRDVRDYPRDFGNDAFNKLIEPKDDFSIFSTYSTSTYVHNLQQQWALVMLEDVLADTGVSVTILGFNIPIQVSTEYVRISVQDQYGNTTAYEIMETSDPLKIGDGTPPPPPTSPPPTQNYSVPQTPSGGGRIETPCCQTGEFYWYYDMPEFQIRTFNE